MSGWRRWRRFGDGRNPVEQEIDEEIALHIDLLTEELTTNGQPAATARAEAENRFGDPRRYRSACQAIDAKHRRNRFWHSWTVGFAHDLVTVLRGLRRSPVFAALTVALLALGIGGSSAIFSLLDAVVLRPLDYDDAERLVAVWDLRKGDRGTATPANYLDWRNQSSLLEGLAAFDRDAPTLVGDGDPVRVKGALVSHAFFETMRAQPSLGRLFARDPLDVSGVPVVVLGHRLWQSRFGGDSAMIGKTVEIDGEAHEVVGVTPPGFEFPTGAALWRPLVFDFDVAGSRGAQYLRVIGRLADGADLVQAQTEIDTVAQRLAEIYPKTNTHRGVLLVPLHEQMVGAVRPMLIALLAAVGIVLFIACVNVASLSLARTARRLRELSVRSALGAGRWRLVRQLLLECTLLASAGAITGLLVARATLSTVTAVFPRDLPRLDQASLDSRVLAFAIVITLLTSFLCALAPVRALARTDLNGVLKDAARGLQTRLRDGRLRRTLVVGEMALALILVIAAGLLIRSMDRVLDVDPGFRIQNLLTFKLQLPEARYPVEKMALSYEALASDLDALPGVHAVGLVPWLPLQYGWSFSFKVVGEPEREPGEGHGGNLRMINADYFRTLEIPILSGRGFLASDHLDAEPVMVINQTLAKRTFGDTDPLGQLILMGYSGADDEPVPRRVVGVVGDVHQHGLERGRPSSMYVPHTQVPFDSMAVILHSETAPESLAAAARAVVWKHDPSLAIDDMQTMRERLRGSLAIQRFVRGLLSAFAAIALALAALGVYGLASESVAQRRAEIGLRMALGAHGRDIVSMVLRRSLGLAGVGLALGLAGAWPATRLIRHLLYETEAFDPATVAVVALVLISVVLVASWLPARRATRIDPIETLREG